VERLEGTKLKNVSKHSIATNASSTSVQGRHRAKLVGDKIKCASH